MKAEETLPTFAAYKPQCHHSSGDWLAYQTTLCDVRLVEFNKNGKVKQIFAINIGSEPLKALRLVYSKEESTPYLALTFHSKYIIYKKNEEIIKNNVKLTCNIVEFDAGLVAC